jgi:predicted enzyme related to lactoylglutathione lyase
MSTPNAAPEIAGGPVQAELVRGVVFEVSDLKKTRVFYEQVFGHAGGEWRQERKVLAYHGGGQTVEFVQQQRPRAFPDSGYHCAFRVPTGQLEEIASGLAKSGHSINRWREDHPLERSVGYYVEDSSGNIVQLVPSDDFSVLVDHVGIEIHMFDYCEYLYVTALGGRVEYYHGWRTIDHNEAKKWANGDDPCAPWTRRDNPSYRDFLVEDTKTGELRPTRFSAEAGGDRQPRRLRVPRPNGQVFISYGPTRLALISATKVRQEPPEEQVKGTPRVILSTGRSAGDVGRWFEQFPIPQLREGNDFYLRDADGNFCQLTCKS